MESRKRRRPLQKLIARIAQLPNPFKKRSRNERSPLPNSTFDPPHNTAIMAEQEEDFSSLPIADRFGHKVRCPPKLSNP